MQNCLKSVKNFIICPPRINRKSFLLRFVFWVVAFVLFIKVGVEIHGTDFFDSIPGWIYRIGSLVGFICGIVGITSALVARLQDCNMSGRYLLLIFIPLGQLAVIIWTFFCVGTLGQNRFGDDPN